MNIDDTKQMFFTVTEDRVTGLLRIDIEDSIGTPLGFLSIKKEKAAGFVTSLLDVVAGKVSRILPLDMPRVTIDVTGDLTLNPPVGGMMEFNTGV